MTEKEIMQALRCSATREEREKCEMCRKSKNGCLECINSYVYEAADLVERLTDENAALREKAPQWISVKDADRRAPAGQRVLATDGVLVGEAYRTSADSWRRYDDYRLWYDATGRTVTHWMPLPEGPKEGGST